MDRSLFDVEKRVIAEGKTIQVTPDLLLALHRLTQIPPNLEETLNRFLKGSKHEFETYIKPKYEPADPNATFPGFESSGKPNPYYLMETQGSYVGTLCQLMAELETNQKAQLEVIFNHLDRNYLDTFIQEYSEQEDKG
jgi:hypothetical protein